MKATAKHRRPTVARTMYICTYAERTSQALGEGDEPDGEAEIELSTKCEISDPTFQGLVYKIRAAFGVKLEDVYVDPEEGQEVGSFMSTSVQNLYSGEQHRVEHTFTVEKRKVDGIPITDFALAGVKIHH